MLGLLNLEEIHALLLRVPSLVDGLARHDPDFPNAVKDWLAQVEQVLLRNRLSIAAEIATLRGTVIAAERGVMPPVTALSGRTTPRKIREAAATEALRKAGALVADSIRGSEAQFAEAERLVRQLVVVAERKGLLAATPGTPTQQLVTLWNAIRNDAELGAIATHVAGLAGPESALILLDRALSSSG